MSRLQEVNVPPLSLARFKPLIGPETYAAIEDAVRRARIELEGSVLWNVNSTAQGGGVAELLHSQLAYTRGAGVDTRWLVIEGDPEFFRITKRIHHRLHGEPGDGGPLGDAERKHFEEVTKRNEVALQETVRPDDLVILHDPQTAGLVEPLHGTGAKIIWRCHVGADKTNELIEETWEFLYPYIESADAYVFSRHAFVPKQIDPERTELIAPSIDPFSVKNQSMDPATVRAILAHVGLFTGDVQGGAPTFTHVDGSPGRVDHRAEVLSTGPPPSFDTPTVVQVSRWDSLKDPLGVVKGFAEHVDAGTGAHLIVAGPNVRAITDDPEGAETLDEVEAFWRTLPQSRRACVHLACLPMADPEENAAIVNALQRQATVIVQKSIKEGFGLTVTEAMWKSRPVVASAVGGVNEQIVDGECGLLVHDPTDLKEFGEKVLMVLKDPELAGRLGAAAHDCAKEKFLGPRNLLQYLALIERVSRKTAPHA